MIIQAIASHLQTNGYRTTIEWHNTRILILDTSLMIDLNDDRIYLIDLLMDNASENAIEIHLADPESLTKLCNIIKFARP